ncbi:translation initiation factor 3 (IF-3) family protein [Zea mays]|uniref:Translation initiation factor 3 (IF-3) family protein n=1 Tax=Zea mays TaxID=4577 RepID=A0A1D6MFZ8_MAIZE|nr:translation initiation factor 3 (IF-3) family protein [Zea mays]
MPSDNEGEDLGTQLSRLLGLMQDVCTIKSGSHLDSKDAYVTVMHVKFATKKGEHPLCKIDSYMKCSELKWVQLEGPTYNVCYTFLQIDVMSKFFKLMMVGVLLHFFLIVEVVPGPAINE